MSTPLFLGKQQCRIKAKMISVILKFMMNTILIMKKLRVIKINLFDESLRSTVKPKTLQKNTYS